MAIRKNKKRIDPRYFLHETTHRDLEEQPVTRLKEAQQGRLEPYLMGKDWDPDQDPTTRPLESLKGFMLGDFDLADAVRDWSHEVHEWYLMYRYKGESGQSMPEIAAEYMKAKPDRAKAFEYLLGIVKTYDQYTAKISQQISNDIDIGPLQAEFEKANGGEMRKAAQKLPQLFKPTKGTAMRSQRAARQNKSHNDADRATARRDRAKASAGEKF